MHLPEIFHISKDALLHNKRRTFFTMLGLIIGVMSVMLVMSVGAGAQHLITGQIQKQGTDLIGVLAGASDEKGPPASAMGIIITSLTNDDLKAVLDKNNVRHAQEGAAYISGNDTIQWRDYNDNITYTGTTASYPLIEKTDLAGGRFFDEGEEASAAHVIVLGSQVAEDIFGNQNPVDQTVKLKRQEFKVIGVLKAKGSAGFSNPDTGVYIPLLTAQRELLGVKHVLYLRLRVDDTTKLDQTVEEIKTTLKERHNGDEDFSVRTTAQALDILNTITNALKFFLVGIAGISLFVGGVGIMNIMLISVKEKTREIGLRKAVGATTRDIFIQFLVETLLIALSAGIIGILIGTFLAFIIAKIIQSLGYDYAFIIDTTSILIGTATAGLIGIVFGTAPAKQAGKLNPIEALRYE